MYIIDFGCGNGKKLMKLYPDFQIIGVDIGCNLNYCRDNRPFGIWLEHDLENSQAINIHEDILKKSIIICADVIEHLVNPAYLLWNIRKAMNFSPACLISTPERDLLRDSNSFGPPKNLSHVREWNMGEFINLLNAFLFNVKFYGLTISNDMDGRKETSLAILGNNNKNHSKTKILDDHEVRFYISNNT